MLATRAYEALEARLAAHFEAARADRRCESDLFIAYHDVGGDGSDASLAALDAWVAERPDSLAARAARAEALETAGNRKQWEPAVADYARAIELGSTTSSTAEALGYMLYHDLGRPAEAEPVLRRAIAINPRHPMPHYILAGALLDLGRPDEARASLRAFLERTDADEPPSRRADRRGPPPSRTGAIAQFDRGKFILRGSYLIA